MTIKFWVPGEPKALQRHRSRVVQSKGKKPFATMYDPSKGDKADFLSRTTLLAPIVPIEGAIVLSAIFVFGRPDSHYGTGKNGGIVKGSAPKHHTKKPDLDNLVKFVKDAFNTVYYKDDSQIIRFQNVEKKYIDYGHPAPQVEIVLIAREIHVRLSHYEEDSPGFFVAKNSKEEVPFYGS